jgi:hypothetical protein
MAKLVDGVYDPSSVGYGVDSTLVWATSMCGLSSHAESMEDFPGNCTREVIARRVTIEVLGMEHGIAGSVFGVE